MRLFLFVILTFCFWQSNRAASQQSVCAENSTDECFHEPPCALFLAKSKLNGNKLGIFSGIDVESGADVGEGSLLIPIYDPNLNDWSSWHDLVWNGDVRDELLLESHYETKAFLPGVGSTVGCSEPLGNIQMQSVEINDSIGVHRSKDANAGSFGYLNGFTFTASRPLVAGQELFTSCSDSKNTRGFGRKLVRPVPHLQRDGLCLDNIAVKPSTIPSIGRGAFSKRRVKKSAVIISSPVILFDRSQMEILEQFQNAEEKLEYTDRVEKQQLLLNYCYGHPNSTVLLLPYGPGISYINHKRSPNAILDWSKSPLSDSEIRDLTAFDALEFEGHSLMVDVVALRDIEPGEEIFIDYGRAWESAWKLHKKSWNPLPNSQNYFSASDYKRSFPGEPIKTIYEQNEDPYPENIMTACLFQENFKDYDYNDEGGQAVYWTQANKACLRPCEIVEREHIDGKSFYTVEVADITNKLFPEHCNLLPGQKTVLRVPEEAVTLVDREYTSDQHLVSAFRHEIGVPQDFIPVHWMLFDPEPMGDFQLPQLKPGQIENIRWSEDGSIVTPNAYVIGLSPTLRHELLAYCDRLGITEMFRKLTYRGNPLEAGTDEKVVLQGLNWFVQRPRSFWNSNMHWISPLDAGAHEDYLRALSVAGFDDVLKQIGESFGFEGLAAYHVTFIAVSHCTQGYLHYDITNSGAKVFNVIIPLILANETGPELDLQASHSANKGERVGRLRYQYDVASMMGDDATHATSAADYRLDKEMRMAATVYIADINEGNIDAILKDYTQHYPPQDRPDLLLSMAGQHWHQKNPKARLPKPLLETGKFSPEL